eukprot:jgi/Tetstr1/429668/TSEL_019565.t1
MVERCTRTQLAYASVEENTLQNRLTDEDMRGEYIHLPGGWTPTQSSNPALYRSLRHAWHWHTLLDVGADALAQYKLFLLDQPDLDGDIVDADTRLTYLRGSDSVWLQGAEDMLEIAAKQAAVLVEHDDDGAMEPLLAGAHAEQFPLFQLMRLTARVVQEALTHTWIQTDRFSRFLSDITKEAHKWETDRAAIPGSTHHVGSFLPYAPLTWTATSPPRLAHMEPIHKWREGYFPTKRFPATPADGLEGDEEEDDPPPSFPAKSPGHAALIDPRDWIDYLPRAYADSMPPVGLTNPGLRNPRNDEWDRYLTDEKKHATRDEYRHLLWYGVFAAAAHAALTDAMATLCAKNATARDTADANDLLDSAIRAIATCGQAAEDRLTYLRRFKCKKALTGEERVAERLVYSRFFDTTAAQRSNNGVDGLLNALDDKKIRDRATKERADKNKDKDKIKGKPQPGNPARKTTTPQTKEQN